MGQNYCHSCEKRHNTPVGKTCPRKRSDPQQVINKDTNYIGHVGPSECTDRRSTWRARNHLMHTPRLLNFHQLRTVFLI